MTRKPLAFPALSILFLLFCLTAPSFAQSTGVQSRIALPIDESSLVTLHGNVHPYARAEFDQGAVDPGLTMHRMLLLLQRSPAQEATLEELLQEQQDKTSPNFHQWLTPEQFGAQFGPSQQDIQTVTMWLQSQGFQVNSVAKGGILIDFTGTAAQVAQTFHTSIHKYAVQGKQYYANSQDPQIPTALSAVVAGVRSFHNFPARALNHSAGTFHRNPDTGKLSPVGKLPIPQFTLGDGCGIDGGGCEALGPFDLATIYNYAPLWNSQNIDGTGEVIAISGETDINPADWMNFWAMFGVSSPKGKLNIIVSGPDPGVQGDEPEADIDTQWSSAVARGATIDYVETEATEATLGVDLSDEYIVDNNLAGVMSESYGICELFIGTSGNTFYNSIWQQAAAQGITVFISSGDQGSAVCDADQAFANYGLQVNGFGSTPYNVSVGGTDFNDLSTKSKYWSLTNNSTNSSNALSYVPEMTWNDSCTNAEVFSYVEVSSAEQSCNNPTIENSNIFAVEGGSGGASNCTSSTGPSPNLCSGGYAKPSWQSGPGVPGDGKRDVPDVSLFASNGFNGSFYIICQSDAGPDACSLTGGNIQGYGGTSVASPAFAGIMALIEQKTGERQGNANYVFYKIASAAQNSCNSNSAGSNCVFYDIPSGSTIAMPCATGSPNCTTSNKSDSYGVLSGYATGSGYDQATGLGSVNVTNLVTQWSTYSGAFKGSKFSAFTMGPPTTITHGQSMPVVATVVPQSGTGTPTGTIILESNNGSTSSGQSIAPQALALTNGSLASGATTAFLPGGTSYSLTAHYSGDGTYAPSDSSPVTVTVNPEPSKTASALFTFDPNTGQVLNSNATSVPYGSFYILRTNVTNSSGNLCATNDVPIYDCPTGILTVKDTYNGTTGALDGGNFPLNAEGYAEDQLIFLSGGQHAISASYAGDKSFNASAGSDTITVTKAPTTISFNGVPSTSNYGSQTTLVATINAAGVFMPGGEPISAFPADNVVFSEDGTPLTGQVTYTYLQSSTGVSGVASLVVTLSKSGNHSFTAQFQGDANYSASVVSASSTTDVQYGTYETISATSYTINHGASVTFTASVTTQQTGGPAITGTVQFSSNAGNIGGPVTVSNGQAQVTTSTLPGGNDYIYAQYSGDTNYQSYQTSITETVNLLNTGTSVSTSNAAITQGTSVTLTATVAASTPGGPAPTGTVQFGYEPYIGRGLYSVGSPVTLTNGQATLTTTAIASGTQFVGAIYSGDANYNTSTGTAAEVVTAAPTFSVTANPGALNIGAPGQSGSMVLTFTAANGFSGTVPLTASDCAGLPTAAACVFSAASVTIGSSGTATANLTITTTAPSMAPPMAPSNSDRMRLLLFAVGAALIAAFFVFARFDAPSRRRKIAFAVLAFALIATFSSCGGGGGGGGCTNCLKNPGTPVGGDAVTVTFSGAGVTPPPTLSISMYVN